MKKQVWVFVGAVAWALFCGAFWDVSHDLMKTTVFAQSGLYQSLLILGWFVFGGLSATLWPSGKKKE